MAACRHLDGQHSSSGNKQACDKATDRSAEQEVAQRTQPSQPVRRRCRPQAGSGLRMLLRRFVVAGASAATAASETSLPSFRCASVRERFLRRWSATCIAGCSAGPAAGAGLPSLVDASPAPGRPSGSGSESAVAPDMSELAAAGSAASGRVPPAQSARSSSIAWRDPAARVLPGSRRWIS